MYSNYLQFSTPGSFTFAWPAGVSVVWFKIWGAGASGPSSIYTQLGGASASGAYGWGRAARPTSGQSSIVIGAGGASVAANLAQNGNKGADTSFDSCSCIANSAQAADTPPGWATGTDGGSGGVASGPMINNGAVPIGGGFDGWIPGGMGQASAPVVVYDWNPPARYVNGSFPKGADAPCGGRGASNGQSGQSPGGGGAPGNNVTPSGAGGDGRVEIYW